MRKKEIPFESIACIRKIAASVLLKLFINGNERYHTNDGTLFSNENNIYNFHDSRGPERNIPTQ